MNLNDLMKAAKEQAQQGNTTMYLQTEMINTFTDELERHKQKKNGSFIWIIPFQLHLPFHPLDPKDPSYNSKKPFRVPVGVTEFIRTIKPAMRENEELHKFYAGLAGMKIDEYDISSDDPTELDRKVFNQFKMPIQLSADTQRYTMADCGQFGMERKTILTKDEEGNIINTDNIQYQLMDLENMIRVEKVAEFYLNNDKSKLSSDQKDTLSTIKRSSQIGYPRTSGVLLFLEFPCDIKEEKLVEITNIDEIKDYYRYVNCNSTLLKKLMKRVGKRKDKNLDYLILNVTYGDGKSDTKSEELALADSREFDYVDLYNFDDPDDARNEDAVYDPRVAFKGKFDDIFLPDITEGLSGKYEKLVRRNVWKFKNISDDELLGYYFNRAKEIAGYVTQEIYDRYIPLIEMANIEVAEELHKLAKSNKLPISFKHVVNATPTLIKESEDLASMDKLDDDDDESEDYDINDEKLEGVGIASLVPEE